MKFKNINEIKVDDDLKVVVNYKTKFMPYVSIVFSIALCFLKNIYAFVLAGIMVIFALLIIFLVKDYKVIAIYEKGIILFNPKNNNEGCYIAYDEIVEWTIKKSKSGCDSVWLRFNDDSEYFADSFQTSTARKYLNKFISNKESYELRMAQGKKEPTSFKQTLKNIGSGIKDLFDK